MRHPDPGRSLHLGMRDGELAGKPYAQALARAGLVANYNSIPFDPRKPFDPSGLRLGTAGITSRGLKPEHMSHLADWMQRTVDHHTDPEKLDRMGAEVREFCRDFPAPGLC